MGGSSIPKGWNTLSPEPKDAHQLLLIFFFIFKSSVEVWLIYSVVSNCSDLFFLAEGVKYTNLSFTLAIP